LRNRRPAEFGCYLILKLAQEILNLFFFYLRSAGNSVPTTFTAHRLRSVAYRARQI
jgi:hypothetical protein